MAEAAQEGSDGEIEDAGEVDMAMEIDEDEPERTDLEDDIAMKPTIKLVQQVRYIFFIF